MNSIRTGLILAVATPLLVLGESSPTLAVDEPPELTGPIRKFTPPSQIHQEFGKLLEIEQWKDSDPSKMRKIRDNVTEFLGRHPDFAPGYMMRATGDFCILASDDYDGITADIAKTLSTRTPNDEGLIDVPNLLSMRGKVRLKAGRYKEALDDLEAAMKAKLDDADKIFGSGEVKPETTNSNPCIWTMGDLDAFAQKFPKDYRVPLLRGLYITFFTTFGEKYYPQALRELERAALLSPRSAFPPFFIGELYSHSAFWTKAARASEEGKNEPRRKAIGYYTKAIQLDPQFTLAYAMRASSYHGLKQYQQAIADYTKVLELDSENITAYADRGLAYLEIGNYSAATVDLGEAIRRKDENSNTLSMSYEYLGDAYSNLGMYRDAIENYSRAIKYQLANLTHLITLKQIRGLYPEYSNVSDDVLVTKINTLFWPQYDHATMANILADKEKEWQISMINNLYEKRGDVYLRSGDYRRGVRDFNRIFVGIPAFADTVERRRLMGGKTGEEWFIDVKSTEFTYTPRLWAKFMDKNHSYQVQSFDFDCKNRRIAVTSTATYSKDNELVNSSDGGPGWQRVIPETREEQMFFGMCGR